MQPAIAREETTTNVTGLSLVLFLFLSLISMMAAYEANKPPEESSTAVVVSFHEYVTQTADTDTNEHAVLVAFRRLRSAAFAVVFDIASGYFPHVPALSKDFDARGPPNSLFRLPA